MIAQIPAPRQLLFWRVHFALAVVCAVDAFVGLASLPPQFAAAMETRSSPADFVLTLGLPLPFILGPLIAEAGNVFQKAFLWPFVWRALLMLCVLLSVVSALMVATFTAMSQAPVPASVWLLSSAAWLIALMQLIPMWRYAYRSGHLWMPVTA